MVLVVEDSADSQVEVGVQAFLIPMISSSKSYFVRYTAHANIFSAFFSSMGGGGGGGAEDMFSGMGGMGGGRGGGPRMRSSRMGGGGGGMGGMPGMSGMGGGMPGGFGAGDPSQSSAPPPPGEIVKPLALTLEELFKGGTKRLKITRHMRGGSQEEKVLEVVYKAGWKKVDLLESCYH